MILIKKLSSSSLKKYVEKLEIDILTNLQSLIRNLLHSNFSFYCKKKERERETQIFVNNQEYEAKDLMEIDSR